MSTLAERISRMSQSRSQFRAEGKRRKRAAAALAGKRPPLGSAAAPVAFAHSADAHSLAVNPNTAKRHASRAGLNLADPASAARGRVSRNEGRRKRGEISRTPHLESWNERIPALGSTISRRVPRA
jgi:hypothetical protein